VYKALTYNVSQTDESKASKSRVKTVLNPIINPIFFIFNVFTQYFQTWQY